jgi:hypothetical protein
MPIQGDAHPAIRTKKHEGNLLRLCQMISGCASSAASYLPQLPEGGEIANSFSWFLSWMDGYLEEKGMTFQAVRADKQLRRGVARAACRRRHLAYADSRNPIVRVVWLIDTGHGIPHLITAYPPAKRSIP